MGDLLNAFSRFLAYLGSDVERREVLAINPQFVMLGDDDKLSAGQISSLLPTFKRGINGDENAMVDAPDYIKIKVAELREIARVFPGQLHELNEYIDEMIVSPENNDQVGAKRHYKKRRTVRRKKAGRVHRKKTHARRH